MEVEITLEDFRLFRQASVEWFGVEGGAPAILFGDLDQMATLMDERGEDLFLKWQFILEHGELKPDTYELKPPLEIDRKWMDHWEGPNPIERFSVKENHLKLLRSAYWRIDSFGIDGKYPYGNLRYFEREVMEIVGEEPVPPSGEKLSPAQEQKCRQLHYETLPTLQIFLHNFTLHEGKYEVNP